MSVGERRGAALGTLAQFCAGVIAFDPQALLDLMIQMNPGLLCLDGRYAVGVTPHR